jgi:hypothetical protein
LSLTGDVPYRPTIDKADWSFDETFYAWHAGAGCILDEDGIDEESNACILIGRESEVTTRGSDGRCMGIDCYLYLCFCKVILQYDSTDLVY